MAFSPINFLAFELKGNQFKGEIKPALLELVSKEIVWAIDLVIVQKDANGKVTMRQMQPIAPSTMAIFDPLKAPQQQQYAPAVQYEALPAATSQVDLTAKLQRLASCTLQAY